MTGSTGGTCQVDTGAVREQLARILRSKPFQQSQRRQKFLQYLVDQALAGQADRLKGYAIAVEVFERPESFDPLVDPVVRVEAGRLRDKLREYYDSEGRNDPVVIELPKGGYAPHICARAGLSPDASGPAPTPLDPALPAQPATDASDSARLNLVPGIATMARSPWILLGIAVMVLAGIALWAAGGGDGRALPDHPSIAVLPFQNIGQDAKWQRFADGMTEDIITDLSQARDMVVIARNSTAVYQGKPTDVRQIGRDLNVRYVLEGSLQPVGERLRVTAQLIDTTTGGHVWSERYDRQADDLFAVQDEVTQRIAATLVTYQGAVAEAERGRLKRQPPANLSAYDTYLLGIEAKHKVTPEGLAEAERLFRRVLDIDPKFARAYCGLATIQYYLIDLGLAPSVEDAVQRMVEAGRKAVELDPNDGLTHQVLGMAYGYAGKVEQSLAEMSRAEALAPSNADILLVVAWSLPQLGEPQRAVALADRALRLNPSYPDWYNQGLSIIYLFGGQYEKSVKYRMLVKDPVAVDDAFIAIGQAHAGRMKEASAAAAKARGLDPTWSAERYLSEAGGYPETSAEMFVEGARKVGFQACVPADQRATMPKLIAVPSCERQRVAGSAVSAK